MSRYSMQILWSDEDQSFIATCPELSDASAFGSTPAKAAKQLEKALALVIEVHHEKKWPLPEPEKVVSYSGQLRLRLPKTLHASLATRARRESVSLNTFIVTSLSEDLGRKNQADCFLTQFRDIVQLQFWNLPTRWEQLRAPVTTTVPVLPGNRAPCAIDGMFVSDGSGNFNAKARGAANG